MRLDEVHAQEPSAGDEAMAERGREQAERIRKEFEDKAKGETRQLDPAKAAKERRTAGKPVECPDVRETVRRKAKESSG
jgi:hypothetical protein